MSDKNTDLLDDLLAIEGDAPVELLIGGHTLHIRRNHTGMQIVEWQTIEVKRVQAREAALGDKDDDDSAKVKKLADVGLAYLKAMLTFLCEEPTTKKDIEAVVKILKGSSGQLMDKVAARIFAESGLFTDKGDHVPFTQPSETEESTGD